MQTIKIKGKRVPVPWRDANTMGAVVAEPSNEFLNEVHYGGHVICESVDEDYLPLIIGAPKLFTILKSVLADVASGDLDSESIQEAAALIQELETP